MLYSIIHDGLLRLGCAAFTAFVVSLVVGAWLIRLFRRRNVIEDTTQPDHAGLNAIQSQKKNVPTMGGLMMIAGIVAATLLWSDLRSAYVWIGILCMTVLGLAGFFDDYIKLKHKLLGQQAGGRPARGLSKKQKLVVQFLLGGLVGYLLILAAAGHDYGQQVVFPFVRRPLEFGYYYIFWAGLIMAATSNAVNLTDGLDGMAGGCTAITAIALALVVPSAFFHYDLDDRNALNVLVLLVAVAGAVLGFLWYNCHPAQIFMGDTGSLALGGLLAYAALATKTDLLLFPFGLMFFIDEFTVALQVASFKLTGRRIFPITPIHHYFQVHRKWPEQKIVARAWIIGALASALSLMALACFWKRI